MKAFYYLDFLERSATNSKFFEFLISRFLFIAKQLLIKINNSKKKLFFIFLFFNFLGMASFAQDYFIYIGGEKHYFEISPNKILVQFAEDKDVSDIAEIVKENSSFELTDVKKLERNLCLISFDGTNKSNIVTLSKKWKNNNNILYSGVVFVDQSGKEIAALINYVTIRLKEEYDYSILQESIQSYQVDNVSQDEFDKNKYLLNVNYSSEKDAMQIANELYETGKFDFVEPDLLLFIEYNNVPNDTYFPQQWGLYNTGQDNGVVGVDIKSLQAWSITTGTSSIKVAILDSGVELDHPDLQANLLTGFDATVASGVGNQGNHSGHPHGTNCAGIVAAVGKNNMGVIGVAYSSKILPIHMGSSPQASFVAKGLNWARINGARVVSMSFGTIQTNDVNTAISNALNSGCVLVAAAGNSNTAVGYPANVDGVIAVGAIDRCGIRSGKANITGSCDPWSFNASSYGSRLDVVASGSSVYTTNINGTYTSSFGGTSAACPMVAGVAALILSVNPNLTPQIVREIICTTAQKLDHYASQFQTDPQHPYGTWYEEVGYGMVDSYASVKAAQCYGTTLPLVSGVIQQYMSPWTTPLRANGNITIPAGVTLTITSQVRFDSNVSLTIKPGGKLIIDGGILTNGCNNNFWKGIIIEGNQSLPQNATNQGTIELLNGAVIENALTAISNRNAGFNYSGAIIIGNGATLRNNIHHLYYGNYDNGTTNLSVFENCSFILDQNYPNKNTTTPLSTIRLDNLRTITFRQCTLSNKSGRPAVDGIEAMNSGFRIVAKCNSSYPPTPCCYYNCANGGIPSIMSGFNNAIRSNTTGNQFSISITDSEFYDNHTGIAISGINNSCVIAANKIYTNSNQPGFGAFFGNTTGYKVEANQFYGNNISNFGMYISGSGISNNFIYRNEISNYVEGIKVVGNNGVNSSDKSGLQFTCNKFNGCQYDIFMGEATTIHPWQGTSYNGADNKFYNTIHKNLMSHYNNNYTVTYFYSGAANVSNVKYPSQIANQYTLASGGVNECASGLYYEPIVIIWPKAGGSIEDYDNPYIEMQNEYDILMNEYIINNYDIIIKQIDDGKGAIIPLHTVNRAVYLRNRLYELGNQMTYMSNMSITYILSDSIVDFEHLKRWYEVVRTPVAKYSLAELYYKVGKYTLADQVLLDIPEQFNFGEDENYEHENYMRFHAMKNTLAIDGRRWDELTEVEINTLRFIRDNTKGRSSTMANGVLCFYYSDCEEIEIPNFEEKLEPKLIEFKNSNLYETQNAVVSAYPNPTSGLIDVFSSSNEIVILKCDVLDITGHKLLTMKNNESFLKLNLSDLEKGTYFVRVMLSNGNVDIIKIVKH